MKSLAHASRKWSNTLSKKGSSKRSSPVCHLPIQQQTTRHTNHTGVQVSPHTKQAAAQGCSARLASLFPDAPLSLRHTPEVPVVFAASHVSLLLSKVQHVCRNDGNR